MILKRNFFERGYYGVKSYRVLSLRRGLTQFICTTSPLKKNLRFMPTTPPRFTQVRPANPYRFFKNYAQLKHYVILGIGANCGECLVRFWKLFRKIQEKNTLLSVSSILKNPAFGYTNQADFYNAILWVRTRLGYVEFWSYCAYLERVFGRKRKRPFKNAPRTLDLDIIGFKNQWISLKHFRIPHIAWNQRESVKIPLFTQDAYQVRQQWRQV